MWSHRIFVVSGFDSSSSFVQVYCHRFGYRIEILYIFCCLSFVYVYLKNLVALHYISGTFQNALIAKAANDVGDIIALNVEKRGDVR